MFRYVLVFTLICINCSPAIAAQEKSKDDAASTFNHPAKTVTITDEQNGKDVEVPQGGTLIVRLPGNPTTGYSWAVAGDPAPLRFIKTRNLKSNASQPSLGAPGIQELRFATPATGISTLTLEYRRPWEHGGAAAKTFSVKVNVR